MAWTSCENGLADYREMRLRFAKWRAVITIGKGIPSKGCIHANTHALARYAALCQEAGALYHIVEPGGDGVEGDHDLETCFAVTQSVQRELFVQLEDQRVDPRCLILKPNMVLPGQESATQASTDEVATGHRSVSFGIGAGGCGGSSVFIGRAVATDGYGTPECYARTIWQVITMAADLFFFEGLTGYWRASPLLEGSREEKCKSRAAKILYNRMLLNDLARKGEYKPGIGKGVWIDQQKIPVLRCSAQSKDTADYSDRTFTKVEVEASYPGGAHAWLGYLNHTLRYPDDKVRILQTLRNPLLTPSSDFSPDFASAARIDWKLMVKKVSKMMKAAASAKMPGPMSMR